MKLYCINFTVNFQSKQGHFNFLIPKTSLHSFLKVRIYQCIFFGDMAKGLFGEILAKMLFLRIGSNLFVR